MVNQRKRKHLPNTKSKARWSGHYRVNTVRGSIVNVQKVKKTTNVRIEAVKPFLQRKEPDPESIESIS